MSDDTNFVPRLDGTGSLGRTDKRWNEVHAKTYHGDGSNLTGLTIDQVTGAAPADNYLTTFDQPASSTDPIVGVGNTITVDTGLTYTPGQYITITLRIDNSLNQLSRVVSYNALSGQLQYAAPYSVGAGVANGNTSHEGEWDMNIAETPTLRYTAQSTANGLRTTPTPGQPGSGGNALGFGAAGQITLGFDLQYETGDYVKMAEYDDLSDYQVAEVVSYDTETGVLVFDTPTIVEGSTSASDQIFTATLAVAEEVRATAAEETLQTNIDAEETARIAADANLQTQISNIGGSGLTNWTENANGHIIPNSNEAYDLGNANNKVRHLFLSDNSLWVGENHKISIDGGEMKFRKRKTNDLPLALRGKGIADDPGSVSLARLHELADLHGVPPETLFDGDDFDDENNEDVRLASEEWERSSATDRWIKIATANDTHSKSHATANGTLLVTLDNPLLDSGPSCSFIVKAAFQPREQGNLNWHTSHYHESSTYVSCEPINSEDTAGLDPSTDIAIVYFWDGAADMDSWGGSLHFNNGLASTNYKHWGMTNSGTPPWRIELWVKAPYENATCYVSKLGGTDGASKDSYYFDSTDNAGKVDGWQLTSNQQWQAALPPSEIPQSIIDDGNENVYKRDGRIFAQWADKRYGSLEVDSLIVAGNDLDAAVTANTTAISNIVSNDLIELSQESLLPDTTGLQLGTMIYDTNEHNVKVVSPAANGIKIWKTLSFV